MLKSPPNTTSSSPSTASVNPSSRINTTSSSGANPTAAADSSIDSGEPHEPQAYRPSKSHRSNPSASGKTLTVPSTHSKGLYSIAREKTSDLLTNLAVRSKTSASSLRSRTQPIHNKQTSASTSGSSKVDSKIGNSQSSRESHSSSSSIDETIKEEASNDPPGPSITLDRPSIDRGLAPNRPSTDKRRLLDRSPSPSLRSQSESYSSNPHNKMHQTSSRLLRMTEDERPYTRDFKDLFSTLMVSMPLNAHRVRFQKIDHTFTSEEAINNLGSLKFSQSNRMPDPKDPSRIVTTTTTTTFSMAKEMARSVCQRFMDARFIEAADGKPPNTFPLKNAVWQMTPKGIHVLQRFCQRNGITQRHVLDVLDSPRNTMHLVILERDFSSDKIDSDRSTIEVIFRRFAGLDGPNIKSTTAVSDSDSLSDYNNGMVGVKMAKERKIYDRVYTNTFTGKAGADWLMDCCTTVDRRETKEICELFVKYNLIHQIYEDKPYQLSNPTATNFQPTKNSIYTVTEKGQKVAGWIGNDRSSETESKEPTASSSKSNALRADVKQGPRDSNNNRLLVIVNDAALRLLFREYLRDTHCEENLAFFMEVREFTQHYDISERAKMFTRLDAIRESLAAAYGLYNAFLAPGSPCELNIDHNLRNSLAGRMTRAVGDDDAMLKSLQEVVGLFKEAQTSVFKLMSSDSVPKFLKEPRYQNVLREHDFERRAENPAHHSPTPSTLPERTLSRVQREARG